MNALKVRKALESFFLEDIGERDVTSQLIFPDNLQAKGTFLVKDTGVFAGTDVIEQGFRLIDDRIQISFYKKDGDFVEKGDTLATVQGPIASLLTAERVILNVIQRMSGIATMTQRAVRALESDHTRICDTRKTMPGLRMFDKYAVVCGGGYNHRFGLYDGVMIKDNHIAFAGSITNAVTSVKEKLGHMVKVEVETETEEQVREAVAAGADIIMFDNRTPEEVREFSKIVPSAIVTEASGGITIENLSEYGKTGVDYISLGLLTHSTGALDISFNIEV
ncbi:MULTISPECIES: carboxylating nicotinate-nucleotide diphosphorylase [Bacillus cereus group]|uniref:Probable nicotinate-nucleotide pyrophosphorylase [carboxylating] n=1 Tax=Bacillus cereus TaxID=1396 RepID=A0AA44TG93_BACCE|nr:MULTISPECIES: carboxylating nicotinate-nucleotide diphosphorylase [Bacillus cereus group]PFA23076.1 nicotinate-nucleotide diphosphorylase (carboxylating) [Bacillus cereus]PFN05485.1 nicotinate-nucleotide diphosphorylase (carboxylating) [Bacillus cereus]PFO82222.1 nicotinate-nucleotide diphosphorylase (carboxylating) [Bacillus cereus]PFR25797.1 nicotinate-nucleotide diphosphorylase (carboxylating) [Bacillus cereus]PFS06674.1 nicotinate-nucleotide diphosphorylase (carboxylating) [Bacillus cer